MEPGLCLSDTKISIQMCGVRRNTLYFYPTTKNKFPGGTGSKPTGGSREIRVIVKSVSEDMLNIFGLWKEYRIAPMISKYYRQ